jgi:hypothetical protein
MAKKLAMIIGVVLVVVGLLGLLIPNPIVGDEGVFQTNNLHDLFHILTGVIFMVAASKGELASAQTMIVFGFVYLALTVLGFLTGEGDLLGLVRINTADNFLHLALTLVFLGVGYGLKPKATV